MTITKKELEVIVKALDYYINNHLISEAEQEVYSRLKRINDICQVLK